MSSIQNTPLQKFSLPYRKILLATLFLSLHSMGSLILLKFDGFSIILALLIISILLLALIPILYFVKRREWISSLLMFVLVLSVITNCSTLPVMPIGFLLLLPIYQIMAKKNQTKFFFGFLLLLMVYLVVTQSTLFFPLLTTNTPAISNWNWILSSITLLPVVYFLMDQSKPETQQNDQAAEWFNSREEYFAAIEAVDIGLWSWNILENTLKISDKCASFLEFSNPSNDQMLIIEGINPILKTLHVDDKDTLHQALFDIVNGRQNSFEINIRAVPKTESQRWLRIRAQAGINSNHIIGSMMDVTQRVQFERKSQFYETYDPLTNLPNKKAICDQIEGLIASSPNHDELNFGVMLLNIDRFNAINESLGRNIGDDLLKAFSQRLERCMRMVDGVARLSEDTFIVLVTEINSYRNIHLVAERIQERVKLPFWIQRNEIYVTAGIGIALYHPEIINADEILQEAEIAMVNAKSKGNGTHIIYQPEMREIVTRRHGIERDLRKALDNHEFELYFQPILSMSSGIVSGVEALIRWHHPENGMISPVEFIPIAEETGLIIPIGNWVLETACQHLAEIRRNHPETHQLTMSVNLSASQLSESLVKTVSRILAENDLSGSSLIFEITESTVMNQSDMVSRLITDLREQKVRIHIDDFGTGYSSFQYLQNFPVDSIKIDRSFISQLENSHNNFEIVRTVVNLAHELGMTTIAEGVETTFQHEQLKKFGCESIQGYLISRPIPFSDLVDFLLDTAYVEPTYKETISS